jgi:hypothetical protein
VCVRALRRGCEQPGHIYRSKWSSASSIRGDKMAASKCFLTFFPGFSDTIDWRSQHSGSVLKLVQSIDFLLKKKVVNVKSI